MILKYADVPVLYGMQLPELAKGFESALAISPGKRLNWAKTQLSSVFRDGWFVNKKKKKNGDGETVEQHVKHLVELIDRYFPAKHKSLAIAYAECHDDQEAIAHAVIDDIKRDLNPRFNKSSYQISDQDKEAIENLAADILFENEPERKALWHSYRECADETTALFTGMDKVCVMWPCVDFVRSGKYGYSDFQAYWDYWTPENADKKLPPMISHIYKNEIYPEIEKLRMF